MSSSHLISQCCVGDAELCLLGGSQGDEHKSSGLSTLSLSHLLSFSNPTSNLQSPKQNNPSKVQKRAYRAGYSHPHSPSRSLSGDNPIIPRCVRNGTSHMTAAARKSNTCGAGSTAADPGANARTNPAIFAIGEPVMIAYGVHITLGDGNGIS